MISATLSGCFGNEEVEEVVEIDNPLDGLFTSTSWYHYPGAVNASNDTIGYDNLTGNSTPYPASGTYYGIGDTTFEPTIGVTSTGGIHYASFGGAGSRKHGLHLDGPRSNMGEHGTIQSSDS